MMLCNEDPQAFYQAYMDTPLGGPDTALVGEAHRRGDPTILLSAPGTCLKSREREGRHGFPKHHGILVTYDAKTDYVLVRGHNSCVSPACVWTGTVAEYLAMWEVD